MKRMNAAPMIYPYRVYLERKDNQPPYEEITELFGEGGNARNSHPEWRWVEGRDVTKHFMGSDLTGVFYGFRDNKDATQFYLKYC